MSVGTAGFVRERLTQAREARGLSKVALAEMVGVTPTAVAQYEKTGQSPRPEIMNLICERLNFPLSFFLRSTPERDSSPIFWRSTAQATRVARERCHVRLHWLHEITEFLSQHFDFPDLDLPTIKVPSDFREIDRALIEAAATACRERWAFGEAPIPDLLLELENSGVMTARIFAGAETLDAFSQLSSNYGRPFILLAKDKASAVRSRFDAAHELGHMLLHRHVDRRRINDAKDFGLLEKHAHHFASAFLLPAKSFADEVWLPSLDSFRSLKERWGASIGAMIMRSKDLGLIDEYEVKRLWMGYSRRGWRDGEPLDDLIQPEIPRFLSRGFKMLVEEKGLSAVQIVRELGLPSGEIEELAGLPGGYLSGRDAEIKAMPKFRSDDVRRPDHSGSGHIVSLADYSRKN